MTSRRRRGDRRIVDHRSRAGRELHQRALHQIPEGVPPYDGGTNYRPQTTADRSWEWRVPYRPPATGIYGSDELAEAEHWQLSDREVALNALSEWLRQANGRHAAAIQLIQAVVAAGHNRGDGDFIKLWAWRVVSLKWLPETANPVDPQMVTPSGPSPILRGLWYNAEDTTRVAVLKGLQLARSAMLLGRDDIAAAITRAVQEHLLGNRGELRRVWVALLAKGWRV